MCLCHCSLHIFCSHLEVKKLLFQTSSVHLLSSSERLSKIRTHMILLLYSSVLSIYFSRRKKSTFKGLSKKLIKLLDCFQETFTNFAQFLSFFLKENFIGRLKTNSSTSYPHQNPIGYRLN